LTASLLVLIATKTLHKDRLALCYLIYILKISRTISIKMLIYYNTPTILLSTVAKHAKLAHKAIQISLDRNAAYLRYKGLDLSPEKSQ